MGPSLPEAVRQSIIPRLVSTFARVLHAFAPNGPDPHVRLLQGRPCSGTRRGGVKKLEIATGGGRLLGNDSAYDRFVQHRVVWLQTAFKLRRVFAIRDTLHRSHAHPCKVRGVGGDVRVMLSFSAQLCDPRAPNPRDDLRG